VPIVVLVEVRAVDGVGSGLAGVRRPRRHAAAAAADAGSAGRRRLVPLQIGRRVGDVDAERAVWHRVARPVDVDHVRARLGRVVVAVDRPVLVRLPVHLHLERTCSTHARTQISYQPATAKTNSNPILPRNSRILSTK